MAAARAVDITGSVRDDNNKAVAGASVSLIGAAGIIQSTVTDQRGNFFLVRTAPGTYSVLIQAREFQTTRYVNVVVKPYQQLLHDFRMSRGSSQPVVEV